LAQEAYGTVTANTVELLAPARRVGIISALVAIRTIGFVTLVVYLVVRSVVKPLNTIIGGLGEVAGDVSKMGKLIGDISAASSEQAQGIEQLNRTASEMDRVVQQNAAHAEESASASEQMNAQAEQMKGFVQKLVGLGGESRRKMESGNMASVQRSRFPMKRSSPLASKESLPPVTQMSGKGNGHQLIATTKKGNGRTPSSVIPFDEDKMNDISGF
jgi:methyl-accepting chemotaxis protein